MISTSADILAHGQPFVEWFQANLKGQPDWHSGIDAAQFALVFDAWISAYGLTREEFAAIFALFYNETGGSLKPVAEMGGPAYCFGTNGGRKASYNKAPNRLAGDQLVAAGVLTSPGAWNGREWPGGEFAAVSVECDFYKYRGRGLIQTTWRTTYVQQVDPLLAALGYDCCDDLSTEALDQVFLSEPSVYLGAVHAFFVAMGSAWAGVAQQRWASVGAHVSGSQAYGSGIYTRRCAAVYGALDR